MELEKQEKAYQEKLAKFVKEKEELHEKELMVASLLARSLHDVPITSESLTEFIRSKYTILPFQAKDSDHSDTVRRLCFSFDMNFEFQDGGRDFPSVRVLLKRLLSTIRSKKLSKQDFLIPVFHSSPGTRTSRTLDELVVSI